MKLCNSLTSTARLALLAATLSTLPLPLLAAGMAGMQHDEQHQHGASSSDETAAGRPGQAAQVSRTVRIDMGDDMRFRPASLRVRQGETLRLVVANRGKLRHELVLGSADELRAHYAAMLKHPDMEHADANQITLDGGRQGELVWRFDRAGQVHFGCLQPGHYDAGMKGSVDVAPAHRH